ncbi:MAG: hypothetical protein ABI686_01420 [Acidobacteriota bacterium]
MKICPKCQKTYSDENLNFCLNDGTLLTQMSKSEDSLPATVFVNQPPPTNPNENFGSQPAAQSDWNKPNQFSAQPPPKKSKTWIWVLGILGGLVLLCGGGLVGFIALVANMNDSNSNVAVYENRKISASPSALPNNKTNVNDIELSLFNEKFTEYGNLKYKGGELIMSSKRKGTYFVIVPTRNYKTENAVTRITVRNVNEEDSDLGFGLVFHSANQPLKQDYAFLIDSENQKYRVVRHDSQKEIEEIDWTESSAIKDGTQENVLEVRDDGDNMEFFINGESVNSLKNTDGYKDGVSGFYAGDAIPVAFSHLEVSN